MSIHSHSPIGLLLLTSALVLSTIACSPNSKSQNPPAPAPAETPTDTASPVAASSAPKPTTDPSASDTYRDALDKAVGAVTISQSARSLSDWKLVVSRWQKAIQMLKSVSPSSPYGNQAKTKIAEYQRNLAHAQNQVRQLAGEVATASSIAGADSSFAVSSAGSPQTGKIYRATIKRRLGGTPVIDVTFNGSQTYEMIVDTGASSTVITREMADAMGLRQVGNTYVNTASARGVSVPLVYVDSISAGGVAIGSLVVAVGNDALDVGLLGHDFFSDFDVTVKRDVVEFKKR